MGLLCFGGLKLCSCFLGSPEKGTLGISWASHDHLLRKAGRGCVDPISSARFPAEPQGCHTAQREDRPFEQST